MNLLDLGNLDVNYICHWWFHFIEEPPTDTDWMGTSRTRISPKKHPDIHDEYHVQSVHNHVSMIFVLGCSNSISLYKYTCCIRLQMFSQTIRYNGIYVSSELCIYPIDISESPPSSVPAAGEERRAFSGTSGQTSGVRSWRKAAIPAIRFFPGNDCVVVHDGFFFAVGKG